MKKKIEKGYINFSDEVENNKVSVIKTGCSKPALCASIITDYVTRKDFKRNYIDFENYEIEINKVQVDDVLNLQKQIQQSNKLCLPYDGYFLITNIDDNEITLEEYKTVASAIKGQNKFSNDSPITKEIEITPKQIDFLVSQSSINLRDDISNLLKGERVYTVYPSGSGRKKHYSEYIDTITNELKKLGLRYIELNDAPRGGKTVKFMLLNDNDSIKKSYDFHKINGKMLTEKRIKVICNFYDIENYTINKDLSIDVCGDVNLSVRKLTKIPLKFNKVSGNFICQYNEMTSLQGCPKEVGKNFYSVNNRITSLVGSPDYIGGDFTFYDNGYLKSLDGLGDVMGNINIDGKLRDTFDYVSYRRKHTINNIISS